MKKNKYKKRRPSDKVLTAKIRTDGDPVLSKVCEDFEVNEVLRTAVGRSLRAALSAAKYGVGLAANQIGIEKRAIAIQPTGEFVRVMFNPVVVNESQFTETATESCLSYPGIRKEVSRAGGVGVEFEDEQGRKKSEFFTGFEARIIQHEIDHLNGKCKLKPEFLGKLKFNRRKILATKTQGHEEKQKKLSDLVP